MFNAEDAAWIKPLAYSVFAALGGIIGYLMRSIDGQKKPSFARAFIEGTSAGFVGFIVLLICQATGLSETWTGVIVGVSGWLGANVSIQIIEKQVRKKLGIDSTTERPPNANPPQ